MNAYDMVFYIDNYDEHIVINRDSPASGWFELQHYEGLGWSEKMDSGIDTHLRMSIEEWKQYLSARERALNRKQFFQCDWREGWGSLEQRWSECEQSGRMKMCRSYIDWNYGHYIWDYHDFDLPKIKWCPPSLSGVYNAYICPYLGWD